MFSRVEVAAGSASTPYEEEEEGGDEVRDLTFCFFFSRSSLLAFARRFWNHVCTWVRIKLKTLSSK